MTAAPVCALLVAGASTIFAAVAVTVKLTLAPVNPVDDTLTVPTPAVVGVKLEVATPPADVTGEEGLKEPVTPLTVNVIGALLLVTMLPKPSWTVTV